MNYHEASILSPRGKAPGLRFGASIDMSATGYVEVMKDGSGIYWDRKGIVRFTTAHAHLFKLGEIVKGEKGIALISEMLARVRREYSGALAQPLAVKPLAYQPEIPPLWHGGRVIVCHNSPWLSGPRWGMDWNCDHLRQVAIYVQASLAAVLSRPEFVELAEAHIAHAEWARDQARRDFPAIQPMQYSGYTRQWALDALDNMRLDSLKAVA